MPHARMRGLYRGLAETRALSRRLDGPPRGLEATWVAPAIGLEDGDYTSVAHGDALLDWITALATRDAAPTASAQRKLARKAIAPFPGSPLERALCAVGAAMALAGGETGAIAIAWLAQPDLTAAQWTRILTLTSAVPLLLVVQPGALNSAGLTALGRKAAVPVIPVDAADAAALYRVAQECLGRARADRQGAVIECIACTTDPIRAMATQLDAKKICTRRWLDAVAESSSKLARSLKPNLPRAR